MEIKQREADGDDGLAGKYECLTFNEPSTLNIPPATLKNGPSDGRVVSNKHVSLPLIDINGGDDTAADIDRPAEATSIPPITNDAPASFKAAKDGLQSDGKDAGPTTEKAFPRSASSASTKQRNRVGEKEICHLHKFWMYETASRFHVVGGDVMERKFRLLKIDRTTDIEHLSFSENDIVYGKTEMNQLLHTIDEGNKASGGLKLMYSFWGLLGFIRFTGAYYMLLVTKRSAVAVIGGHYIYQIDGTELVSLTDPSTRSKLDRDPEEARFIGVLNNLDLTHSFYFSYSYDITRTLQHNILRERHALEKGHPDNIARDYNTMFVWNHYLLRPVPVELRTTYDWCMPIIHGFVDQASTQRHVLGELRLLTLCAEISNYGRSIHITIIARRSRFFAGARFLKRGANDLASHTCSITIEPKLMPRVP